MAWGFSDAVAEHRELDTLLGRFLAAAAAGEDAAARDAIASFDEALRRHTELEEEHLLGPPAKTGLVPADGETTAARLHRELRLEHVQIRELSGMMRRVAHEGGDGVATARRLFANLARRWDAHTAKEERALVP